ncbi:WhiB family transcriptional regulator [Mycolicibacterium nivoides]|uniref:Transcriptional regulator WhiB n=1 Tax=Mycolicibacterium nivoides TaxID=2487344 RepID=A0ABW9LH49_9MYCO
MPIARYLTRFEETWSWRARAACRGADPTLFFKPDNEPRARAAHRERLAKQICHTCPVMLACRSHSVHAGESHGIWGGLTAIERRGL